MLAAELEGEDNVNNRMPTVIEVGVLDDKIVLPSGFCTGRPSFCELRYVNQGVRAAFFSLKPSRDSTYEEAAAQRTPARAPGGS